MEIEDVIKSIKTGIDLSSNGTTRRKFKSILDSLGYSRTSQKLIEQLNSSLKKAGISSNIPIEVGLYSENWITFELEKKVKSPAKANTREKIKVPDDFFKNLFIFESDSEYERFQASLDSYLPVGLFLIPEDEDFFSSIVEKILAYEVIRKKQYKKDSELSIGSLRELTFSSPSDSKDNYYESSSGTFDGFSDLYVFSSRTMNNVIMGTSGIDLLNSEEFDKHVNQLSMFSNKYNFNQFFVLFNCPSSIRIESSNRQNLFDVVYESIANKFPNIFKLKCKFKNYSDIDERTWNNIVNHFKLLFEIPKFDLGFYWPSSLQDAFQEILKSALMFENTAFLRIEEEKFSKISFGQESDEHVLLKYFAINSLLHLYKLDDIKVEETIKLDGNGDEKSTSRPDLLVHDEVVVEIETLRGKAKDKNAYLSLVSNIKKKSIAWKKEFKELWLVLPGFEIARNYYQIKQAKNLIEYQIGTKTKIFCPDYENCILEEIDFSLVYELKFQNSENKIPTFSKIPTQIKSKKDNFSNVYGLKEEKETLSSLIELQAKKKNHNIRGILFFGPPGCGKTFLAKAFAVESQRTFFNLSPADLISIWIGQSSKNIKEIFTQAKMKGASLLFLDELDSIGFQRNSSEFDSHSDQKATINQLLIELSDIHSSSDDIIVIGATNLIKNLDSALLRSGRFDYKIPICPPNLEERADAYKHFIHELSTEFELDSTISGEEFITLANNSKYFSWSDLKYVCEKLKMKILLGKTSKLNFFEVEAEVKIFPSSLNREILIDFAEDLKSLNMVSEKFNMILKENGLE